MQIPYEEIQTLTSRCNDPQMPSSVRESATLIQEWLNSSLDENSITIPKSRYDELIWAEDRLDEVERNTSSDG